MIIPGSVWKRTSFTLGVEIRGTARQQLFRYDGEAGNYRIIETEGIRHT